MIQVFKGVAINEQVKQKKGLAEINRELLQRIIQKFMFKLIKINFR